MLIGLSIAILYFLARKITAEGAEERRAFNQLFPLRAPMRTLRLYFVFGYSMPHVPGSSCIVKSPDSGFRYLSSYVIGIYLILQRNDIPRIRNLSCKRSRHSSLRRRK